MTAKAASSCSGPRFVLCPPAGDPVPWRPPAPPDAVPALGEDFRQDLEYVGGVLGQAAQHLGGHPVTFYVTRDPNQPLPTYGPDIVAVVLADEFARLPPYADRVRAVFKRYGSTPRLLVRPLQGPPQLTLLKLAQYAKKWAVAAPGRAQLIRRTRHLTASQLPVHTFPLGYFRQEPLPMIPIEERPYDLLFYGSSLRGAPEGVRRLTGTVKGLGRAAMLEQVERLRRARPDLRIELVVTDAFGSHGASAESYSEAMMRAKLCLSPAGNSEETYRNYEAWRSGAIPVTEDLLPLWFHQTSPFLRVRPDWADLEEVIEPLLRNPQQLRAAHEGALAHWRDVCSEAAVGSWMAGVILDSA